MRLIKFLNTFPKKWNENIDVYTINDLATLKKLVELFSSVANYSEIGHEGCGTVRNSIKAYYKFKQNADDLSYELADPEIKIKNDEITDLSITNFSYERDLKNSMVLQISELFPEYKIFGKKNEGMEYLIEVKWIDILLENENGVLMAVGLKSRSCEIQGFRSTFNVFGFINGQIFRQTNQR